MTARRRRILIAVGVLLLALLPFLFFELHEIEGESMAPMLRHGDLVLVRRDSDPPERQRAVVMRAPGEGGATVVKRAIGLGGESVLIRDGDVWIDGALQRRSIEQIDATLVPWLTIPDLAIRRRGGVDVLLGRTDQEAVAPQVGRCWLAEDGRHLKIGADDGRARVAVPADDLMDDHVAGSGRWVRGSNVVRDPVLDVELIERPARGAVSFAHVVDGAAHTLVRLQDGGGESRLRLLGPGGLTLVEHRLPPSPTLRLRLYLVDDRRRLELLDPELDAPRVLFDGPREGLGACRSSRLEIAVEGGALVLGRLDISRDIHYTSTSPIGARDGLAPFEVPPHQVFVLGDNSPESRDSRHWGALEIADDVVGRPFLLLWPWHRRGRIGGK